MRRARDKAVFSLHQSRNDDFLNPAKSFRTTLVLVPVRKVCRDRFEDRHTSNSKTSSEDVPRARAESRAPRRSARRFSHGDKAAPSRTLRSLGPRSRAEYGSREHISPGDRSRDFFCTKRERGLLRTRSSAEGGVP